MKFTWRRGAALLLFAAVVLSGCARTAPPEPDTFRVALIDSKGQPDLQVKTALAWQQLQSAREELKADLSRVEAASPELIAPLIRDLLTKKYDMIWVVGFPGSDAVDLLAKGSTGVTFVALDGLVSHPNVAPVLFKEEEGAFLMGLLAARATKSKTIGFLGGMPTESSQRFESGFRAGARTADPTVQVLTAFSGTYRDAAPARNQALSLSARGADVILHSVGTAGPGVLQAAREKGFWVIQGDAEQSEPVDDRTLSVLVKRTDRAVARLIEQWKNKEFPAGRITLLGLRENALDYSGARWDRLPEGSRGLVENWAGAIRDGRVTVPPNAERLQSWEPPKL